MALSSIEHNRKFQLEMGGKNPMVVLDDADLGVAVEAAANSGFFSTGQRCTASSRLIVTEGIHDKFVAALTERLSKLNVDHALKDGTHIGPVVDEKQLQQDCDYIEIGKQEGAKLAFGGERIERDTPGFYLQPTLFTEATNQMRISREEIFGPVAAVIRVKDYEEALAVANDTPFGLSAGIATTSLKHATHFKRNSEAVWSWSTFRPLASISTCPSVAARLPPSARASRENTRRNSSQSSRPPIRWLKSSIR